MKKNLPLSKITFIVTLLILTSSFYTRHLVVFVKGYISDPLLDSIVMSTISVLGVLFVLYIAQKKIPALRFLGGLVVLACMGMILLGIRLPEEKGHILQFALLGWCAAGDREKIDLQPSIVIVLFPYVLNVIVGVSDELLQWVLPYRTFDPLDIIYNILGSLIGILLFKILLEQPRTPAATVIPS